jgi:hypothetical protein
VLPYIQDILNTIYSFKFNFKYVRFSVVCHASLLLQQAVVYSRPIHQIKVTAYSWQRAIPVSQRISPCAWDFMLNFCSIVLHTCNILPKPLLKKNWIGCKINGCILNPLVMCSYIIFDQKKFTPLLVSSYPFLKSFKRPTKILK